MDEWYQESVIYQIYPKSFKDSNNDGVGDLPGITEKLDYVQQLGANTIWLNPIFVSPQIDNGYDVSNYFAIDPLLGNMDDFQTMVKEIHKRKMHLILDLPINDTSDQHPWFQDAVKNKIAFFTNIIFGLKIKANGPITGAHFLVAVSGNLIQMAVPNIIATFLIKRCRI